MPKLSDRLQMLRDLLLEGRPVWDLCCDHGLLGHEALASGLFPEVHFVDCVPEIIHRLREKRGTPPGAFYHAVDAGLLAQDVRGTVVVAGVGGRTIVEIIGSLQRSGRLNAERLVLAPQKRESLFESELTAVLPPTWRLTGRHEVVEGPRVRPVFVWDRGESEAREGDVPVSS